MRGVWAFLIAVKLRIEYIYLPVFVVVVVIVGVVFFAQMLTAAFCHLGCLGNKVWPIRTGRTNCDQTNQ